VTSIDFVRHGETGAVDALHGRTDLPLSEAGRVAVRRMTGGLAWTAIVTSPLMRARETAAILAAASRLSPEVDDAWREIDFGEWDGKPRRDLASDPRLAAFYADPDGHPPPGGEPMGDVRARITAALRHLSARQDGRIAVVTHGGAIRMALSILLAIPLARLWAIRIAFATRIRVEMGHDPEHGLWGEIVEIIQPPAARP